MSNCECRYNRTFHIFETETMYGQNVAGFCVLGRIQQQPLFSLLSAGATSGSLRRSIPDCPAVPSVPSRERWLVREGLFALTTLKEYGCRVHPPHLSMPSSGLVQKYAACKSIAVSLKWDLASRDLHFQKQLQSWGVHIFWVLT